MSLRILSLSSNGLMCVKVPSEKLIYYRVLKIRLATKFAYKFTTLRGNFVSKPIIDFRKERWEDFLHTD